MASAAVRLPGVLPADASHPRKRFTAKQAEAPGSSSIASGSSSSATSSAPRRPQIAGAVPDSVLDDPEINAAIAALLPSNYKLEVHKTIHHIRTYGVTCVALQMPEGLTMWATALTDIIERFTDATTVIMGDVTYGACCVDDYTARALGCDMLVHYGHSCLVPVDQTLIRTLYVFVEISIDVTHLSASIRANFPSSREHFRRKVLKIGGEKEAGNSSSSTVPTAARIQVGVESDAGNGTVSEALDSLALGEEPTHLAIVGTVQFINAIHGLKDALEEAQQLPDRPGQSDEVSHRTRLMITSGEGMSDEAGPAAASASPEASIPSWASGRYRVTVPQIRPLSPGEILGCTSPSLADRDGRLPDAILYLGDGRFHLESAMIANPRVPAFRYDPYEKRLVRERYDHARMRGERAEAVDEARRGLLTARDSNMNDAGDETGERPASSAWGIVLGTLGRQGSRKVLSHLSSTLQQPTDLRTSSSLVTTSQSAPPRAIPHVPILLSELSPQKLRLFGPHLAAFVQTSCPRLSIDWGAAFDRPLLSPYEAAVAIGRTKGWNTDVAGLGVVHEDERRRRARVRKLEGNVTGEREAPAAPSMTNEEDEQQYDYPMDFYADDSRGPWTPRHGMQPVRRKGGISNVALLMRSRKAKDADAGKVQADDKAQTQQHAPSIPPTPPA